MQSKAGDRLVIDNRIGDIVVQFDDTNAVEVDVTKVVWGEDLADAEARAAETKVIIGRRGSSINVDTIRPTISAFGVLIVKDTHIDLTIRAPHGTELALTNKVGNLTVIARDWVSKWDLRSKVGDIALIVGQAGFTYRLETKVGDASVDLGQHSQSGRRIEGSVAGGSGMIVAEVKTGDIRLHH